MLTHVFKCRCHQIPAKVVLINKAFEFYAVRCVRSKVERLYCRDRQDVSIPAREYIAKKEAQKPVTREDLERRIARVSRDCLDRMFDFEQAFYVED